MEIEERERQSILPIGEKQWFVFGPDYEVLHKNWAAQEDPRFFRVAKSEVVRNFKRRSIMANRNLRQAIYSSLQQGQDVAHGPHGGCLKSKCSAYRCTPVLAAYFMGTFPAAHAPSISQLHLVKLSP